MASVGRGTHRRALDELANGLIAKVLMGVGLGDGGQDALARMASCQAEDALNEPNGADAARGERGVGPLLERRADALTLAHESIDVRLLTRRGLGLAGARRKHAGRDPRVHHDERVAVEDAHEVRVPSHADAAARAARAAPDRRPRPTSTWPSVWTVRSPLAKNGNASPASGCSARCSTSTKCVHTWRRVVPWMRSRAIVRFQCRRNAFCASRLSKRRPFSALSLT